MKLNAYICPAGKPTIGYGHTGPDVRMGMVITQEVANSLLSKDVQSFSSGVSQLVKTTLNDNQFSALVSFAYNCGLGNFKTSTLLKYINSNQFQKAADEFPKWNRAGKLVLPGLTRRRIAERELFLS